MSESADYGRLYSKVKVLSNKLRFKIVELTQDKEYNISELSKVLQLSYTKCADYVTVLEREGLVQKTRAGKEVLVRSKTKLSSETVEF